MWHLLLLITCVSAKPSEGPSINLQIGSAEPACGALKYGELCLVDLSTTISVIPGIKNEVACQAECGQVNGCSHFTFHISASQPTTTSCALLRSCDSKTTSSCSDLPECKTAVSGPSTPAITEACCSKFTQRACKGIFLAQHYNVAGPEECQSLCRNTPRCSFFTQYNGDFCFLHSSCDDNEPCSICTTGPASPSWDQCQENNSEETLLIGGWTNLGDYATTMELVKKSHSCTPAMPEPPIARRWAASALLGRTILYCGGYNGNTPPRYHSECYSYLLGKSGSSWKQEASMNHPRGYFSLEVINGQAYAIGGTSDWGTETGSTIEVFTPGLGWKLAKQMKMPSYRYYHCSVTLGSRLIIIGGHYGGTGYSKSVIEFDVDLPENGWTTLTSTKYGRQDHSCQVGLFQGQQGIFVTGGSNSGHTLVEFYVDSINKWRTLPSMKSSRYYHSSAFIENALFLHGGEGGQSTQEMLDTKQDLPTWTSSTNLRTSRKYHSAVNVPKGLLTCNDVNKSG